MKWDNIFMATMFLIVLGYGSYALGCLIELQVELLNYVQY